MLYLKISLCKNTKLRLFLFIHHSPNMVFPYHIYGKGAGGGGMKFYLENLEE